MQRFARSALLLFLFFLAGLAIPCHAQPGSSGAETDPPEPVVRVWTDNTGTFRVTASIFKITDDVVYLERVVDGKIAPVPRRRLSPADKAWLEEYLRATAAEPSAVVSPPRDPPVQLPPAGDVVPPADSDTAAEPLRLIEPQANELHSVANPESGVPDRPLIVQGDRADRRFDDMRGASRQFKPSLNYQPANRVENESAKLPGPPAAKSQLAESVRESVPLTAPPEFAFNVDLPPSPPESIGDGDLPAKPIAETIPPQPVADSESVPGSVTVSAEANSTVPMVARSLAILELPPEELARQIEVAARFEWESSTALSSALEPYPPELRLILELSGWPARHAALIGHVAIGELIDNTGTALCPLPLPPNKLSPMRDWIPVSAGQASGITEGSLYGDYEDSSNGRIASVIRLGKTSENSLRIESVRGTIKLALPGNVETIVSEEIVERTADLRSEFLEDHETTVRVRRPDKGTVVVEATGETGNIVGISPRLPPGVNFTMARSNSRKSAIFQFELSEAVNSGIFLELRVATEWRELTVPFEFKDLQIPLVLPVARN